MFTLYRIVKRSVTKSVPDRASVHTRNAAFRALSVPEQNCSAPLLKVECSVSDRFLKRFESSLNTLSKRAEIATLVLVNHLLKSKTNCMTDRACVHTGNAWKQFLPVHNRTLILVHTVSEQTFETEQKPIRYSVNIASNYTIAIK